jgi:hypothetical protein
MPSRIFAVMTITISMLMPLLVMIGGGGILYRWSLRVIGKRCSAIGTGFPIWIYFLFAVWTKRDRIYFCSAIRTELKSLLYWFMTASAIHFAYPS